MEQRGWAVEADFLPQQDVVALAADARARDLAGEFRAAAIGRGAARMQRAEARGDRILWLEPALPQRAQQPLWTAIEALRLALNRSLQLGLFSVEAHYALYPAGTAYRRHRDRFREADATSDVRVVSFAVYLNQGWTAADGGALRIYDGDRTLDVLPTAGTVVCFLSDRFDHEVLPPMRERLAVTGWLRRRA